MTPEEAHELCITSRRKIGTKSGLAHPDTYARAGSILTICGEDWPVPPLYPSGCVSVAPVFSHDGEVTVDIQADGGCLDDDLVALAATIRDGVTIVDEDICPECGVPARAKVQIDPSGDRELIGNLFAYARRCLLRMYDLTPGQLTEMLRFGGDGLPRWVVQVLDHTAQAPTTGSA